MAGEWLKLRKQRGFVWATLFAFTASVGISALAGSLLRDEWDKDPTGALSLTASMPSTGIYVAGLLFGLGLCIWLADEFVSGSNYLTLLVVPRRNVVFSARFGLIAILSLVFGGAVALIGTGSGFLFVGPERMSKVASEADFWTSVLVTPLVGLCTSLLYFAAATLTRRSLPAVGTVAVVFFLLPSVEAYVSFAGGPTAVSWILSCFPGSLVSGALTVSSGGGTSTFSSLAASLLLMLWSLLLVMGAAWRFARYE